MTNRPIPRRGLLGCWFLDDRGITYDSGANEAIDRSGRGNHATYQNGVTVGVEGDPSREFGAADFDASSNQYATVGSGLTVNGAQAIATIFSYPDSTSDAQYIAGNDRFTNGNRIFADNNGREILFQSNDGSGTTVNARARNLNTNQFYSVVGFTTGSEVGIYTDGNLRDVKSTSGVGTGRNDFEIGRNAEGSVYSDSTIAAVGRYDLTVPNAPEPSEIARRWDRLTDIPATR